MLVLAAHESAEMLAAARQFAPAKLIDPAGQIGLAGVPVVQPIAVALTAGSLPAAVRKHEAPSVEQELVPFDYGA